MIASPAKIAKDADVDDAGGAAGSYGLGVSKPGEYVVWMGIPEVSFELQPDS